GEMTVSDTRNLWIGLAVLLAASFLVLLLVGGQIYRQAPPLPDSVVAEDGTPVFTGDEIRRGRQVWQSIGGMQLGSIWGHGGYVAPDWTADWLHREAVALLNGWSWAEAGGVSFEELDGERPAALRGRLEIRMRANT